MDPEFEDLALLLLYLASWEERDTLGRRAWKGIPFETLDALTERGYLLRSRGAKSVRLTSEGIVRGRELEGRLLRPDSTPGTGPLLDPGTAFELHVTRRRPDPDIALTDERFEPDPGFDPKRYEAEAFGIVWERPMHVVVRFRADQAPYVREREWG